MYQDVLIECTLRNVLKMYQKKYVNWNLISTSPVCLPDVEYHGNVHNIQKLGKHENFDILVCWTMLFLWRKP